VEPPQGLPTPALELARESAVAHHGQAREPFPVAARLAEPMAAAPGRGRGVGLGRVAGAHPRQNRFDKDAYEKIKEALANRDAAAKGKDWERAGAQGDAARAIDDSTATHPARIVSPASLGAAVVKNGDPYAPNFKSIRFLAIPHLNQRFVMDGNFDKWKDIPETP